MSWILCSKKLPDEKGEYIIVTKSAYTERIVGVGLLNYYPMEGGGWNCTDMDTKHELKCYDKSKEQDGIYAWTTKELLTKELEKLS